jgi:hypothetical protein
MAEWTEQQKRIEQYEDIKTSFEVFFNDWLLCNEFPWTAVCAIVIPWLLEEIMDQQSVSEQEANRLLTASIPHIRRGGVWPGL